jgi:hypothetical protein
MSRGKRESSREDLPLPTPTSPRELDDRILSYARRNAPERRAFFPGWAAGLATVSVVLLTVIIVEPQRQQPAAPELSPAAGQSAPEPATAKRNTVTAPSPERRQSAARDLENATEAEAGVSARTLADAPRAAALVPEESAAESPPDSLAENLARCAELLEAGEEARAREQYQRLRSDCRECDLPQTLEQALEQYPPAH